MNIKRKLLIGLLAVGTVAGFGLEIARFRCHDGGRRAAFERHVADVCVDAARRAPGAERAP